MRYRWVGKAIDLDALGMSLEGFLAEKGFLTNRECQKNAQIILATTREKEKVMTVCVRILRGFNDFEVEFSFGRGKSFANKGLLATLLGFGFLVKRGLDDQEYFEKLEKDFWVFANRRVADLAL